MYMYVHVHVMHQNTYSIYMYMYMYMYMYICKGCVYTKFLFSNCPILLDQALTNAGSEIDRLKADLQLARVAANTATESQEAGPHSVPENESMELNPTLDSHAEPDIGCVESEPKLCSMESSQGSGMELDPVRSEMERLRGALRDSRSECGRLREELTALRREFDNEEPAPDQPQVDLSQPAIPPSQVSGMTTIHVYIEYTTSHVHVRTCTCICCLIGYAIHNLDVSTRYIQGIYTYMYMYMYIIL